MKNQIVKMLALTLSLLVTFSATLAGCGQSTGGTASPAPQSGSAVSVTVLSSSDRSLDMSSEEEPEGTESAASDDGGAADSEAAVAGTDAALKTAMAGADIPEPSSVSAGTEAIPESGGGQNTSAGSANPSGIDLNVQFGDDGESFLMHLYDNETAAKIAQHVGTADWRLPIYHYDDYENWEVMQYYDIPSRYEIPSNPENVTSERAGTVYYSEPNRIVLFYQDANVSSEYTPVGYFDYTQAFVDAVVNNPVVEGWGNKLIHIGDEN